MTEPDAPPRIPKGRPLPGRPPRPRIRSKCPLEFDALMLEAGEGRHWLLRLHHSGGVLRKLTGPRGQRSQGDGVDRRFCWPGRL